MPVRPDGKITTPLIDDLAALGKTPTELARDMEKALVKYIRDPVVTVVVTNFVGPASEQVRVIGEAAKPQTLPYRKDMTVLDVMIAVGGLTDFADGNGATIFRVADGGKLYSVRLQRPGQARRHHGERRHAARRHPDHSAKLVLARGRIRRSSPDSVSERIMQELIHQLLAICAACGIAAGSVWPRHGSPRSSASAIVYKIPERYEASARVYVDTESLLRPLLAGLAIQPNLDQQVSLMSRTLISRPNVEKLVRHRGSRPAGANAAERDELIDNVDQDDQARGQCHRATSISSATAIPIPEQARKVVQSLLAIFVESSLGDKRQDTQTAVKFLDEQIKRYEDNLQASENRMKDFKLKYLGVANTAKAGLFRADVAISVRHRGAPARAAGGRGVAGFVQARNDRRDAEAAAGDRPEPRGARFVPEIDARIAALQRELGHAACASTRISTRTSSRRSV